jgi:hypothetical protein
VNAYVRRLVRRLVRQLRVARTRGDLVASILLEQRVLNELAR